MVFFLEDCFVAVFGDWGSVVEVIQGGACAGGAEGGAGLGGAAGVEEAFFEGGNVAVFLGEIGLEGLELDREGGKAGGGWVGFWVGGDGGGSRRGKVRRSSEGGVADSNGGCSGCNSRVSWGGGRNNGGGGLTIVEWNSVDAHEGIAGAVDAARFRAEDKSVEVFDSFL